MGPPADITGHLVGKSNPFPGLRPFELEESEFFFGRNAETNDLLSRLRQTRFLAVLGESGSGKSSIVRAGLLASLQAGFMVDSGGSWRKALMRPGEDPLARLAEALSRPQALGTAAGPPAEQESIFLAILRRGPRGLVEAAREGPLPPSSRLLVVVDQFEELFRYLHGAGNVVAHDSAAAFVKVLLEAADQRAVPIFVVLTMRSEYLGRCASLPGLAEAISDGLYLVPQMTRAQLRETIERPAALAGGKIANRLVNRLLNDVRGDADQLPVLQHALRRLWSLGRRADNSSPLDLDDYRQITSAALRPRPGEPLDTSRNVPSSGPVVPSDAVEGSLPAAVERPPDKDGTSGGWLAMALSAHADEAYNRLTPAEQTIAQALFRGLSERGETGLDTRRPTALGTVAAVAGVGVAEVVPVVEVFRHPEMSFLTPPQGTLGPDTILDISHESLIRNWDRLREWSREEADSADEYLRLAETAQRWKRGKAALDRPPGLDSTLRWKEKEKPTPAWAARYGGDLALAMEFLQASERKWREDRDEASAARTREKNLKRAWKIVWVGVPLLLVAIGLTVWALWERSRADSARADAEKRQQEAVIQSKDAISARLTADIRRREAEKATAAATAATIAYKGEVEKVKEAEKEAKRQAAIANALRLAEQPNSVAERHPQLGMLQAAELLQTPLRAGDPPIPAAAQALQQALTRIGGKGLCRHADKVYCVALSPNGRWLATGSGDTMVRLWDLTLPDPAARSILLRGHYGTVSALAFSPDGRWLASGSWDGRARLWDMKAGKPATAPVVLQGGLDVVYALAISPDSHWLATGGRDNNVWLWDLQAKEVAKSGRKFLGHKGTIWALDFSPDGRWLASAGEDKSARLWDLKAKDPAGAALILAGHTDIVSAVSFSPEGRWLATGSDDKSARLWDLPSKDFATHPIILSGHDNTVYTVAFSPDRRWLATGSGDKTARLWDLDSKNLNATVTILRGHEDTILKLAFTSDGRRLATASQDGTVRLWDPLGQQLPLTGASALALLGGTIGTAPLLAAPMPFLATAPDAVLRGHEDRVSGLALSADGRWLATCSHDKTARVWDLTRRDFFASPAVLRGHAHMVDGVAISPDGRWLVSGSRDRTALVWELADPGAAPQALSGHQDAVFTVAFSPDGKHLATGSWDKTIRLWDWPLPSTSSPYMVLTVPEGGISSLAYSPDGHWLAICSSTGKIVRLWDLKAKDPAASPVELSQTDKPSSIAISPDSRRLAVGTDGKNVTLYDLNTSPPKSVVVLRGHTDTVEAVAFSANGRWLVSGSYDKTARLWDLAAKDPNGQPIVLRGHEGRIYHVAISPDNRLLATGSQDKTARLWDLTAKDPGAESTVLRGHEGFVFAVAFTLDSRHLATGSADATVRLWMVRLDDLLKVASVTVGRNFSEDEWKQFFPDQTYRKTFLTAPGPVPPTDLVLTGGRAEVTGELTDLSDRAIFAVSMKSGKRYQVDMVSTEVDSFLRLEDGTGKQLAADDDSGGFPNARLRFSCDVDATYKIIATTSRKFEMGKFTMTVQELPAPANPVPEENLVLKGGQAQAEGELTASDPWDKVRAGCAYKVYVVPLAARKRYQIDMASNKFTSYVRVEGGAKQLASDPFGSRRRGSRIVFTCTQDTTYRIIATTARPGDTGSYSLTVRQLPDPPPPIVITLQDGRARVEGELTALDPWDEVRMDSYCNVYTAQFSAGKTYQIDMASTMLDSYLRLEDGSGKQLTTDDDSGGDLNARIIFPCERSGTYRIIATTFVSEDKGKYTLTVQQK